MLLSAAKKNAFSQTVLLGLVLVAALMGLGACANRNHEVERLAKDASNTEDFDGSLTFNSVTLEQANEKGQLWWKVKAKKAIYSNDKKQAQIESPKGELFQDGKPIFEISAQKGEVQQDGKKIFLSGQIIATDVRDKLVLRGNELEWRPEEDLLIVRNKITGVHQQVQMSANEARAYSRKRQVEFLGQVVAVSQKPALQMRTEHLTWQIPQKRLTSDRPIQIVRFINGKPTDQALGDQAEVNLNAQTALLQQNAQLLLLDPPIQVASNSLLWNLGVQTVSSDQPVSVLNRQQQMMLTGNQGSFNLKQKTAQLVGNVQGIGQRNQSQLRSDLLDWNMTTEEFVAQGNVFYRQNNPAFNLKGPKAFGKIRDQTVVVSGGRVVTEIIP
ncbi:MAG: LPS export ABC transporter periplasmic protein LptC [Scytolyngbya sp. HA4215-MV1]|nr:LPS export ABC transporter periplasmic protein LptC [Scytolyngbya sp. HA4215-MV1]